MSLILLGISPVRSEEDNEGLYFRIGPVLGHVGRDFFTVTCRTNLPADVTLHVDSRILNSARKEIHRFKVENLSPHTDYSYHLTARDRTSKPEKETKTKKAVVRTLPDSDNFRFIVIGDSRSSRRAWPEVARAVLSVKPKVSFMVHTGDMVNNGLIEKQWDNHFFGPASAKELFANMPMFVTMGNHEKNTPFFTEIFMTPGGGKNWVQVVNNVLLIGIDGKEEWNKRDKLQWLEEKLKRSKEQYIFLLTHYPAWCSAYHAGKLAESRSNEVEICNARDYILPMLEKYNVTAMIAGHEHNYERSEPKGGVTVVIAGGAGAPMSGKIENAEEMNPYSAVFAKKYHYCVFEVSKSQCKMDVFSVSGEKIDSKVWFPRKSK